MRLRIAWAATALWLLAVAWLFFSDWPEAVSWSPTEAAHAIGAAFAPVIALWLAVAFFEQADALQRHTEALHAQLRQLDLQVQGTRSLALVAVRQAEAMVRLVQLERQRFQEESRNRMRAAQPRFVLAEGVRHPRAGSIRLHNIGAPASSLVVVTMAPVKASIQPAAYVQSGAYLNLDFEAPDFTRVQADIEYSDADGVRRRCTLAWSGDEVEIGAPNLDEAA